MKAPDGYGDADMNRATRVAIWWLAWTLASCGSSSPGGAARHGSPKSATLAGPSTRVRGAEPLARREIAFTYRDVLYMARGDGSKRQVITDFPGPAYPYAGAYWAPDGTQLIVRTEAETGKGLAGYIYRVDADGSDLVNLSKQSGARYDAMPAWSPDGTEIVYTATKPDDSFRRSMSWTGTGRNPER